MARQTILRRLRRKPHHHPRGHLARSRHPRHPRMPHRLQRHHRHRSSTHRQKHPTMGPLRRPQPPNRRIKKNRQNPIFFFPYYIRPECFRYKYNHATGYTIRLSKEGLNALYIIARCVPSFCSRIDRIKNYSYAFKCSTQNRFTTPVLITPVNRCCTRRTYDSPVDRLTPAR